MDIVTKKQLNILIQLAEADKHFAKSEREMIFRIARDRHFPEETVNELIRSPEPIDSLGALSAEQKFEYLMSSIDLIFADRAYGKVLCLRMREVQTADRGRGEHGEAFGERYAGGFTRVQ